MKCHVKIDAIECLPCYLKVSFYHENDDQREYPFSIIRLNIPGVRVGSAASRTKSFTYGVFWKNNRKRCRLFLAFQDKQSCSMHMKWLKRSIESLEFYRKGSSLSLFLFSHDLHFIFLFLVFLFTLKSFGNDTIVKNSSNACFDFKCVHYDFVDILENHRISRTILSAVQTAEEDFESQLNNSRSSTLNDTQTERDMNDILGPLPEIPTSNADYCNRLSTRRSSGGSGIYEEILDPVESSM